MNISTHEQQGVLAQSQVCQQQSVQVLLWLLASLSVGCVFFYANILALVPDNLAVEFSYIAATLAALVLGVLSFKVWRYLGSRRYLTHYKKMRDRLDNACVDSSLASIQGVMSEATALAKSNHLIALLLESFKPKLHSRMTKLHRRSLMQEFEKESAAFEASCKRKIREKIGQVPLFKAKKQIESSLEFLAKRRTEMSAQWEVAYEGFSWWNKLKYATGPDFSEIDQAIRELSSLQRNLFTQHADDFEALDQHFKKSQNKALSRIASTKLEALRYIQDSDYQDSLGSPLLKKALWFSALSVPVSVWSDFDRAGDVYDSLRAVNSNFASMSDTEIWWETLFMPAESLAGLASLTKGAYFEHLVAQDTGGVLFEHFNNPDTDIVIDGIAFQLKATDSVGYVNSVDDTIPVIATSEVAIATGAIDSGYSNEELSQTIDSALGGTVVDVGDTAVDALLTGLGGLGFFATVDGINHASEKYENGGDAVEAIFEGAGVAIEGTARALVGAAEMGYNVLASRPSRFIGRTVLKGLVKLDDKMMGAGPPK